MKSNRVKKLIKKIIEYASNRDIVVRQYSRVQIRSAFEDFSAVSKYEIAVQIAKFFPHLNKVLSPKPKCYLPQNHYQGMFDAMSLVLSHHFLSNP